MFKIAALKNIRNLFPDDHNPFFCGFGNRDTDAVSYRAVGINLDRIFIINHDGEIHHYNSAYKKSYPLLTELADDMFPAFNRALNHVVEAVDNIVSEVIDKISEIQNPVQASDESQLNLDLIEEPIINNGMIDKEILEASSP
jgi:phosphatidate phosphatase PAH1